MQGTILGQNGGGSSALNVFAQLAEPSKKDGIWIKTEECISNIPYYIKLRDLASSNSILTNRAININNDIYYTYNKKNYKYSTITNEFTELTDIPYSFYGAVTSINNKIYFFGSNTSDYTAKYVYEYDTLTDTYTRLADLPYELLQGSVSSIGNDIYIFGCYGGSFVYKYNTLTNEYTQLTSIPGDNISGDKGRYSVAIGNKIYICKNALTTLYMYDISTDTYTKLKNLPNKPSNSSITTIENYIYLFGFTSHPEMVYRYNTLTNEYTQLTDIPDNLSNKSGVSIEDNIYILGENISESKKLLYKTTIKTYKQINKYKYNKVKILSNLYARLQDLPYNGMTTFKGVTATVGYNIYWFLSTASNVNSTIAYNTVTNKYISASAVPTGTIISITNAVAIGTDIYLFGKYANGNSYRLYKYNTITNSYTFVSDLSEVAHIAVAIENNIYFTKISTGGVTPLYKYDIVTNECTKLTNIPFNNDNGSIIAIDNNIYFFGSSNSSNSSKAYKYNILTNECTQLENIPYVFYNGSVVAVKNNICLFGANNKAYKYNIDTNKYIKLKDIPYDFSQGSAETVNGEIYLFGSNVEGYSNYLYKYDIAELENGTILIQGEAVNKTKLTKELEIGFQKANLYIDGATEYPCYYGDGENWHLIEENAS